MFDTIGLSSECVGVEFGGVEGEVEEVVWGGLRRVGGCWRRRW